MADARGDVKELAAQVDIWLEPAIDWQRFSVVPWIMPLSVPTPPAAQLLLE